MSIIGIDHVLIEVPEGAEDACRDFYLGVLGLHEIERARAEPGRSFLWVNLGNQQIHFHCGADFRPAALAHPGLLASDLDGLAERLAAAGHAVTRADAVSQGRFHVRDPFGNRLEFVAARGRDSLDLKLRE